LQTVEKKGKLLKNGLSAEREKELCSGEGKNGEGIFDF